MSYVTLFTSISGALTYESKLIAFWDSFWSEDSKRVADFEDKTKIYVGWLIEMCSTESFEMCRELYR